MEPSAGTYSRILDLLQEGVDAETQEWRWPNGVRFPCPSFQLLLPPAASAVPVCSPTRTCYTWGLGSLFCLQPSKCTALWSWQLSLGTLTSALPRRYPDVCTLLGDEKARELFPLRRAHLVHYTWIDQSLKGHKYV